MTTESGNMQDKYDYITPDYKPKSTEERTVWAMKYFGNETDFFFWCLRKEYDNTQRQHDFSKLDLEFEYKGKRIFDILVEQENTIQISRLFEFLLKTPSTDKAKVLHLDSPESCKKMLEIIHYQPPLHRCPDGLYSAKPEDKEKHKNYQAINRMLFILMPRQELATHLFPGSKDTPFSLALKFNDMDEALNQAREIKRTDDEGVFAQMNYDDPFVQKRILGVLRSQNSTAKNISEVLEKKLSANGWRRLNGWGDSFRDRSSGDYDR